MAFTEAPDKKYDSNPLMSKRISLDEHGRPLSDGSHFLDDSRRRNESI